MSESIDNFNEDFHVLLSGESDNLDSLKEFFGNKRSGECFHYARVPLNYSIDYAGLSSEEFGLFSVYGIINVHSLVLTRVKFFAWITPICKKVFLDKNGYRYLRINDHSYRWSLKNQEWELF